MRSRIVSLRLSDDEHRALAEVAAVVGVDLSELIRRAALALTYPAPSTPTTGTMSAPLVRVMVGDGTRR
jgi:ribosomal protein L12E/L44/L45/RPP1/RPP2